jgi:hypothetical protein
MPPLASHTVGRRYRDALRRRRRLASRGARQRARAGPDRRPSLGLVSHSVGLSTSRFIVAKARVSAKTIFMRRWRSPSASCLDAIREIRPIKCGRLFGSPAVLNAS